MPLYDLNGTQWPLYPVLVVVCGDGEDVVPMPGSSSVPGRPAGSRTCSIRAPRRSPATTCPILGGSLAVGGLLLAANFIGCGPVPPASDEARWRAGRGPCWLRCVPGVWISILGRGACPHRASPARFGMPAGGRMVLRTSKAPGEAPGYQPRNCPWLAQKVASEAAMAAATTAMTRRRTGRSADQRRPRDTARRVRPITM